MKVGMKRRLKGPGGKKGWKGGFGNLALKLKTRFPSSLAAPCWDHDDDEEADNWTVGTLSRFTRQEVLCCSGLTFMKDKGHCAGRQHKQREEGEGYNALNIMQLTNRTE